MRPAGPLMKVAYRAFTKLKMTRFPMSSRFNLPASVVVRARAGVFQDQFSSKANTDRRIGNARIPCRCCESDGSRDKPTIDALGHRALICWSTAATVASSPRFPVPQCSRRPILACFREEGASCGTSINGARSRSSAPCRIRVVAPSIMIRAFATWAPRPMRDRALSGRQARHS